jgi:hypothetical protein
MIGPDPAMRGRNQAQGKGGRMVTAFVQIKILKPLSREKVRDLAVESAPQYRPVQGLIRKYYILSADGKTAGGVYLWKSRKDAERLYTEEWEKRLEKIYGAKPAVTYFQSYVVVDNKIGEILQDE